ncbi:MAG: succinate dehydrogenase iron-sulfur subunit [Zetaproteobacteria bacterium]|nr:MAG: succinate dehydrogenase iron-sulfur subunit [Zetaproteobacteria bacterium]
MAIVLEVFRFDPERDARPRMQRYEVPRLREGMMLLDALIYIKEHLDGTLTFRRSCREGVCGSDGMNINGINGLACITPVDGLKQPIKVRPLTGFEVIRDLVVDMRHFFAQYRMVQPWLQAESPAPERERLQSPEERARLDGLYECILCGCCTSSCPAWWWNGDRFLGPAALLAAYRWLEDSRDEAAGQRLDLLEDAFRVFRCRQIMNCMDCCPKGLNPTAAIDGIKRKLAARRI